MKKIFLLVLFLFVCSFAHANTTLKRRLIKAKVGDYIVTQQGSHYSLLLVRALNDSRLTLEEIMVPTSNIELKKISWQEWIKNKAPGASSWESFVFDLTKNSLAQCFSHLQNQWLFIEKSDYLFGQLLTLSMRPTKDNERKRIGPAPNPGEIDRRRIWKPQMVRSGKKVKSPKYEILRTIWPSDESRLAGCVIEMYLDAENPEFPFPYWIEIQSPHYTFKIRAIDSGSNIISPARLLK